MNMGIISPLCGAITLFFIAVHAVMGAELRHAQDSFDFVLAVSRVAGPESLSRAEQRNLGNWLQTNVPNLNKHGYHTARWQGDGKLELRGASNAATCSPNSLDTKSDLFKMKCHTSSDSQARFAQTPADLNKALMTPTWYVIPKASPWINVFPHPVSYFQVSEKGLWGCPTDLDKGYCTGNPIGPYNMLVPAGSLHTHPVNLFSAWVHPLTPPLHS